MTFKTKKANFYLGTKTGTRLYS
uniref:Uncharacterized protein n=1 Tax=Anguilla anguilla TaxID=7936 RepID=A0A0E9UY20_ANGAN